MILYITHTYPVEESIGIWKKVLGQTRALKKYFGNVCITARYNQVTYLLDEDNIIERKVALTKEASYDCIKKWIKKYNIDKTYIRYHKANNQFIQFLRWQKKEHIQSILEIPTFPYDNEIPYGRLKIEDSIYRQMISEYIDVIATYSKDKRIWNIPTIMLQNGVDVNSYFKQDKRNNNIKMIAVSSMLPSHGYERLIEGMNLYCENGGDNVYVWFVGLGREEKRYKEMVKSYSLGRYVKFWGIKTGSELNELYSQSDIAVGSLGLFKIDLDFATPIKIGEYLLRGLPIIIAYKDGRIPEDVPFVLQIPNDNTPVNIPQILDFYRNLQKDESYAVKIRKYAEDNLSWDSVMRPVVEYFKSS